MRPEPLLCADEGIRELKICLAISSRMNSIVENSWALVLIVVLSVSGWRLAQQNQLVNRRAAAAQGIVDANKRLVFLTESGIDVWGRPVLFFETTETRRAIVFLLRSATLQADLEFWRKAKSLVPKDAGIRLIGYCDGDDCANSIRGATGVPDFPVIEYGEVQGTQAILNADAEGDCILVRDHKRSPLSFKRVSWRSDAQTPFSVVREAVQ